MATVVVIGGGPAGMMAAIKAAENNKVILLEKNEKLGKKLYITGKGRCNVTSSKDISEFFDYIPCNPDFLYSALYSFTNEDCRNFFENSGVKLKVERGDRVFPESDKSSDIINSLERTLNKLNVQIIYNSSVKLFTTEKNHIISAKLSNDTTINGDYFILCTGGVSYPGTGSTGDGLRLSKRLGHNIIEPKPALIPLVCEEDWVKELQGLSLKNVEIKFINNRNKTIYKDFGEMLFTHFGISGPIVLSGSSMITDYNNIKAVINLKPALSSEQLDKRIQNDFSKNLNKDFKNSLDDLLPQKLIPVIIRLTHIDPLKKVNSISKEERHTLVNLIKNLTVKITGTRPIAEAIITSGGIDVKEIEPSTMRSRIIYNMYFAGEIIDVDALTGGFNIQIALSTGFLAGSSVGND